MLRSSTPTRVEINQYEELEIMPLDRVSAFQTTRFTEKKKKKNYEGLGQQPWIAVRCASKRAAKRVRFLWIVMKIELGHKLERWLAWEGEALITVILLWEPRMGMLRCAFYTMHFNKRERAMLSQWKKEKLMDRPRVGGGNAARGSEQREDRGRERRPYGVAVWEIADGDGQRAHNRWALREIITGSQKVTMNYSNNKFALCNRNMRKEDLARGPPFRGRTNRDGQ